MRSIKSVIPFFAVIPALAAGCAEPAEDAASEEAAITASAEAGVKARAAVGAVVVDGKKICTAALVDVDANARIGSASAHARQIVMGGACIGKLRNNFLGGAAFVTQKNGVTLSTPIAAIDFQSQAAAGLAVGILSNALPNVEPLPVLGVQAEAGVGAHASTLVQADENGLIVAARVTAEVDVGFSLKTECTSVTFSAGAAVSGGAAASITEDGFGVAIVADASGHLYFGASIDGGCIVRKFTANIATIRSEVLEAANDIGDTFASIGTRVPGVELIAVRDLPTSQGQSKHAVRFYLADPTNTLYISGQGRISARLDGASCDAIVGDCKLALTPAFNKFKRGWNTVEVDTHANLFGGDTRVFITAQR